jgi:hypothetical protein
LLFRINMYRLGRERRLESQRRLQRVASLAAVLSINVVVAGLFVFALVLTGTETAAHETRLKASESAIQKFMEEQGGPVFSDEELNLVRARAAEVKWSIVLRTVARLTPGEIWLPRVRLSEAYMGITNERVMGLRLSGRLRAGQEQEGLTKVMDYVAVLRTDHYFAEHFSEPKLVDSTWLSESGKDYLEFDVFCPLLETSALAGEAQMSSSENADMVEPSEVEPQGGDATDSVGTGAGGESTS